MSAPDPDLAARRQVELAGLGPFVAVQAHPAGAEPDGGWRRVGELITDPARLRSRVEAAREVLAVSSGRPVARVPLAVTASVVQLGLNARLVSPLLALAALHGVDRVPGPDDLWWQDELGGAFPLSVSGSVLGAAPAPTPDRSGWAAGVTGILLSLSEAVAVLSPSRHVRTGNIASAVHGAVAALAQAPGGPPAGREQAPVLGRLLLDQPALRGAATGIPGAPGFRRRSCCLLYRLTADGSRGYRSVCADCILPA